MYTQFWRLLMLSGFVVLTANAAWSQTTTLQGDVKDENEQPVKGAVIVLDRTDGKGHYQLRTTVTGHWIYSGLPLGSFDISCIVNGQVMGTVTGVHSRYGDAPPINFDLHNVRQSPQPTTQVPNRSPQQATAATQQIPPGPLPQSPAPRTTPSINPMAERALAQEPEMQQIFRVSGTQPYQASAAPGQKVNQLHTALQQGMQLYTATKAIWILQQQLRYRLKEDLLYGPECQAGKCQIKEEEVVLLQQIIDQNDTASLFRDAREWKDDEDKERQNRGDYGDRGRGWYDIREYCQTISGRPTDQQMRSNSPVDQAAYGAFLKRVDACMVANKAGVDSRDRGTAEAAHEKAMKSCDRLYDRTKSVYNQAAYNACMNKSDTSTQACTKTRQFLKLVGSCPGEQPPDVKDLGLASK